MNIINKQMLKKYHFFSLVNMYAMLTIPTKYHGRSLNQLFDSMNNSTFAAKR